MYRRAAFLCLSLALLASCDDGPQDPLRDFPMHGTWQAISNTWFDAEGNVIKEDDYLDQGRVYIQSVFPSGEMQHFEFGGVTYPEVKYLIYSVVEWDAPNLDASVDSLRDCEDQVHIWDGSSWHPPYFVAPFFRAVVESGEHGLAKIYSELYDDKIIETRWVLLSAAPEDLTQRLIEVGPCSDTESNRPLQPPKGVLD